MTPEMVYQRFRKKRITTVTRLEYDKVYFTVQYNTNICNTHNVCQLAELEAQTLSQHSQNY